MLNFLKIQSASACMLLLAASGCEFSYVAPSPKTSSSQSETITFTGPVASLQFLTGSDSPTPPDPDPYGDQSSIVQHTYTLTNNGEAQSVSTEISTSMGGANASSWSIVSDTCSGQKLAVGATCTIQVEFLATTQPSGSFSAQLRATALNGGTASHSMTGSVTCPTIVTQTYSSPTSGLSFAVPAGCTTLVVRAWGAGGGFNPNSCGGAATAGAGAFVRANVPVQPGSTITVRVGGAGVFNVGGASPGGLNGGGDAGNTWAAGGGGYTGVFNGSTPLLVAGGGGGAGPCTLGGDGGAPNGGNATNGNGGAQGGRGATASTGGAAGAGGGMGGSPGGGGSFLTGGAGGNGGATFGGAGGGGGYFGGGGGQSQSFTFSGGGGGGSSYIIAGSTHTAMLAGSGGQADSSDPYWSSSAGNQNEDGLLIIKFQ
jgi:hypothetical protein